MKKYHISTNLFERFDIIGQVPSVSNGELVNQSYGATTSPIPVSSWLCVMAANFTTANNLYLFLYDDVLECVGYAQITSSGVIKSVDISGYTMASYVRIRVDNLASFTADNGTIMFNDGLEPLPYEPFMSDNLFSETQWMDYNKWTDSAGTTHNEGYGYQCNLLWSGGDITAKVHGELPYSYSACFYDSSDAFISRTHFTSEYMGNANTISVPSGTAKIIFQVACPTTEYIEYDTVHSYKIMVNSGSTPKPYTPYGTTWQTYIPPKRGTATDSFTALPATIHGDGTNATAIEIQGNMTQTGTPTSANPIFPSETGERTENLFNKTDYTNVDARGNAVDNKVIDNTSISFTSQSSSAYSGVFITVTNYQNYIDNYDGTTEYTISADVTTDTECTLRFVKNANTINLPVGTTRCTFTGTSTADWVFYVVNKVANINISKIMVATTNTTVFEPYGYKIPIVCGNTTTPYYLSEPIRKIGTYTDVASDTVTRKIKKFVCTGQETGWQNNYGTSLFGLSFSGVSEPSIAGVGSISSHYTYNPIQTGLNAGLSNGEYAVQVTVGATTLYIKNETYTTVSDWKSYLQQQYQNGTPVTVWYVLSTPTTESFTAPTIPTTGTAEQFDVATTLKPSEVSLTYHGWHKHAEKKRENGDWT